MQKTPKRSVRRNRYDNWCGYEGTKFVREFAHEPAFLVACSGTEAGAGDMPDSAKLWLNYGFTELTAENTTLAQQAKPFLDALSGNKCGNDLLASRLTAKMMGDIEETVEMNLQQEEDMRAICAKHTAPLTNLADAVALYIEARDAYAKRTSSRNADTLDFSYTHMKTCLALYQERQAE